MYELNGIVYADDPTPILKVKTVRPLDNYKLFVQFSTGEEKEVDIAPLLNEPAFIPLKDKSVFDRVYVDYGAPVWNNGTIDIAPEYLYQNGAPNTGIKENEIK
ncbi:hypothetical protein AGMMS4952_23240 [Spirochaetia bacterium]|nr:hypothetical protein AGMMS4952_23240 [Spirochaetia bacterium]